MTAVVNLCSLHASQPHTACVALLTHYMRLNAVVNYQLPWARCRKGRSSRIMRSELM